MSLKLRDLIKKVRESKTAAEERAIVAKECAAIRGSFGEKDNVTRARCISKLLYIHMLGYPTAFGQMECLKLIISPYYNDKRIGYLGLSLLLDEKQEVLTLVTNSLQTDMANSNQYIVSLALSAIANIASPGIARDLSADVEKLMSSPSPFIRKKSTLAAIRIVRKCPDLCENYVAKVRGYYKTEKNHGVLLAASSLVLEICKLRPNFTKEFYPIISFCCRVLKALVGAGFVPEYDINGVCDPFLQVRMLRILRLLGPEASVRKDTKITGMMRDILTQVATTTESARNVGNAILYECVQTILAIPLEASLRVTAINVLGRFLANRDNNIRYVALNTLKQVVEAEGGAQLIRRHRQTIVNCLKDSDISIRRRALDLVYALVDSTNIRQMTRELLSYLVIADKQFRPNIAAKLCWLIERFAPNKRWQFDSTLRVISVAGTAIPEEVGASLCAIVSQSTEIQAYAVQRLYALLVKDKSQKDLVSVGLWCFGEFGDLLCGTAASASPDGSDDTVEECLTASPAQLLDLIEAIMRAGYDDIMIQQYALVTVAKLSDRFPAADAATQSRIREILNRYQTNIFVDIQQRACEFSRLFNWSQVKSEVFDRMPAPSVDKDFEPSSQPDAAPAAAPAPAATGAQADVLSALTGMAPSNLVPQTSAPAGQPASNDVLAALFGSGPAAPAPAAAAAPAPAPATGNALDALFGAPAAAPAQAPAAKPTLQVYNKNGLNVYFEVSHPGGNPAATDALAHFTAAPGAMPVVDLLMRVAVPKWLLLKLEPASSNALNPASPEMTQLIHLMNKQTSNPVLLRIQLSYRTPALPNPVDETVEIAFPANM